MTNGIRTRGDSDEGVAPALYNAAVVAVNDARACSKAAAAARVAAALRCSATGSGAWSMGTQGSLSRRVLCGWFPSRVYSEESTGVASYTGSPADTSSSSSSSSFGANIFHQHMGAAVPGARSYLAPGGLRMVRTTMVPWEGQESGDTEFSRPSWEPLTVRS